MTALNNRHLGGQSFSTKAEQLSYSNKIYNITVRGHLDGHSSSDQLISDDSIKRQKFLWSMNLAILVLIMITITGLCSDAIGVVLEARFRLILETMTHQ